MNKIYRLVWNHAHHRVEVASELAHCKRTGGAVARGVVGQVAGTPGLRLSLIAVAMAGLFAMLAAFAAPISCDDGGTGSLQCGTGATAAGSASTALGSSANAQGSKSIAVGSGAIIKDYSASFAGDTPTNAVAVGTGAESDGVNSIAIGNGANITPYLGNLSDPNSAPAQNALAIGNGAAVLNKSDSATALSDGATVKAYSPGAVALGQDAFVGQGAVAAIALGKDTKATKANGIAIGNAAQATGAGNGSVAIGQGSLAMGAGTAVQDISNSMTISAGAGPAADGVLLKTGDTVATDVGTANTATAIGQDAAVLGAGSVGIGNAVAVTGPRSVAIGDNAAASGFRSTSPGDHSFAQGDYSIAIGADSTDTGVVGAQAAGKNSVALGADSLVTQDDAMALGHGASSTFAGAVALGSDSTADRADSVAVGNSTTQRQIIYVAKGTADTDAVNVSQLKGLTTALGGGAGVDGTTGAVTAPSYTIGSTTYNNVGAALAALGAGGSGNLHVSGTKMYSTGATAGGGTSAIAIGSGAVADSSTGNGDPIALGYQADVTGQDSLGIGGQATVSGTGSLMLGGNLTAAGDAMTGDNSTALGVGATTTTFNNSVALGAGSRVAGDNEVSVGTTSSTRKITNVTDGTVAAGSHDAVNGEQLFNTGTGVANVLGGGTTYNPATGAYTASNIGGTGKSTFADAIGANKTQIDSNTGDIAANAAQIGTNTSDIAALGNSGVQYDNPATKDKVTFGGTATTDGGATNGTTLTNLHQGAVGATSSDAVNGSQLYGTANSVAGALGGGSTVNPDGTVSAPSYNVAGTSYNNVGDAISNLQTRAPVQYSDGAGTATPTTPSNDVTLVGAAAGPVTLHNVADGTVAAGSHDAVNGEQLTHWSID